VHTSPQHDPSSDARGRAFAIPMRARFRGITVREGLLVRGPAGWGEFSPFAEYPPQECARWWEACREAAEDGWPAPVRDRVPVNATVPAVGPEHAARIVAASGCATAKVKVAEPGQDLAQDLDRLAAVRDALGPAGRLRVDANGAWDPPTAAHALGRMGRFDLEYAEQPCAGVEDLALLRRRVDVPIAADESIRRADDPLRVRDAEAADVVVLKVQPLGGVRRALEVAEQCGLPAVVSSALETSVGLAAGVALAAALPRLPFACGLATMALLEADVCADPFTVRDGALEVRRPQVTEQALAALEVDPAAWRDRLARAVVHSGAVGSTRGTAHE
jgi:o-succinylbenzoate synthase